MDSHVMIRFPWKKYIFPGIFLLVLVLVLILYQRLGGGSMMVIHETWSSVVGIEHDNHFLQHHDPGDDDNRHHHHHHHHHNDDRYGAENHAAHAGHDHNEQVHFVLHESALGAPEFIGRNQRKAIYMDFDAPNTFLNAAGDSVAGVFNSNNYKDNNIAIGLAITTREQTDLTADTLATELPFFKVRTVTVFALKLYFIYII